MIPPEPHGPADFKSGYFTSFLSLKKGENANFIDSGLILMQNDTHRPILIFKVEKLFQIL